MKYGTLVIWIFLMAQVTVGQVSWTATTDAEKMVVNSTANITFTLANAKGSGLQPPSFAGLRVVAGPSTSTSMSIVNGKSTSSMAYTYTVQATKEGTFKVGPASIKVNGKVMKTAPITITAVKGKSAAALADEDKKNFVKMVVSDSTAVIGQQLRLDYVLYFAQDVSNYEIASESDYDGFFSSVVKSPNASTRREVVDGTEYYVKVLKSVTLFPQRTGLFELDPVQVSLGISIPGQRRRGFFSRQPTRRVNLFTNELTITVADLPQPQPVSFSGAVGRYRMQADLAKPNITTDEAIIIDMKIRGDGDGKTIKAPQQPVVSDLEYYDPNIVVDKDIVEVGHVDNFKQIEYLIVPKKAKRYTIRPEFTYYDTDSNGYVTLAPRTFSVNVKQGSRKAITDDRDVSVTGQLLPPMTTSQVLSSHMTRFSDPIWYGSLLLFFAVLGGIVYKKRQLDIEAGIDPVERRRQQAKAIAVSQLASAKQHKSVGDSRAFHSEVNRALIGYLGDKFQIPHSELDKAKLIKQLEQANVTADYRDRLVALMSRCEMAVFAGGGSGVSMEESYSEALQLIEEMA